VGRGDFGLYFQQALGFALFAQATRFGLRYLQLVCHVPHRTALAKEFGRSGEHDIFNIAHFPTSSGQLGFQRD
jgi:hypothetical protein